MDGALLEQVKAVLADVFGLKAADLGLQSSPASVESWDSLRHLNMVIALEQEFGFVLAAQEIEEAVSVEAVCRLVADKVKR